MASKMQYIKFFYCLSPLIIGILSFKGHDMLAPFTAGWQTTDVHPLVIEKSEVWKLVPTSQFLVKIPTF